MLRCDFRWSRSCSGGEDSFFESIVPDAEISREVAEWDGALLPLLARGIRGRGETSVSRNKETQPNNNPKERYRTVVQRGVAEGRRKRGKRKWLGGPEPERGDPFLGICALLPFLFSTSFFSFIFLLCVV